MIWIIHVPNKHFTLSRPSVSGREQEAHSALPEELSNTYVVVLQVIFFRTNFCPFETERSFRRYFTMNSNSSWEELRKEVFTMIFLYSLF